MGIGVTLALLAVTLAWLAWAVLRPGGAVRARNALLLDVGAPADFDWTPSAVPPGFEVEREPEPRWREAVAALGLDANAGDWPRALALAGHLAERAGDLGPIMADPWTTYERIRAGHGYCADFVRVYLALAHAAGLFARQWAFSFDGYGGHGHTLVEVWDRQRGRWAMLDVYNNFHAVDTAGAGASALAFRDFAAGRGAPLALRPNGPGRAGYPDPAKLLDYYRRGAPQWYLWWGNAVLAAWRAPAVRAAGLVARRLAYALTNLPGLRPRLRTLPDAAGAAAVLRMLALRRNLVGAALVALILAAALALQVALAPAGAGRA